MIFETNAFGIYNYTLVLILLLPIISTMVSISRHIIGVKTLSLYAPIVLAYAFIEIGMNRPAQSFDPVVSLAYGSAFFLVVLIVATGLYRLLKPLRINYYSKMSLIFTGIASAVFIVYYAAAVLGDRSLSSVNVFSIVLIAAISERLVANYARTDLKGTIVISLETLAVALIGLLIFSIPQLQKILIESPWLIIVIVVINFAVGSFRGLRLTEFWRFSRILDKDYGDK